jgi:excisionase family DNA binding protein
MDLLTVGSVARALRVSEGTVRNWADAGRLPAQRLENGVRLFHRDDVARLALERGAR